MLEFAAPVGVCLLLWWLGTGIVLRLDSLPERTYRLSVVAFTLLVVVVVVGLFTLRNSTTVTSAYLTFTAAIVLWGWLEFLHYSGILLGPGLKRCPDDAPTSKRFMGAVHAMLYHEIAVLLVGIGLMCLLWNSPNKTALYTYLVLWIMRISAELNVFFGVAYLPEEWLPGKLQYLMSYRKTRKLNAFFPVSIIAATAVCLWLFLQLPAKSVDAFGHTSTALTGTLLLLAIVEHWLLVVPTKCVSLWSWAQSRPAS